MVKQTKESVKISLKGKKKAHILNINLASRPKKVKLDNSVLSDSLDYHFDKERHKLVIKTDKYSIGEYFISK